MKVFLSDQHIKAIETASNGSRVLGTYCAEHKVATVTEVREVCYGSDERQPDANASKDEQRFVLAKIGEKKGDFPFQIERENGIIWTDQDGHPVGLEVYETDDFFKRTPFNPEIMQHLQEERVLVIGVGSVGAPMGLELAKSGVGALIMVDKDILEIHNCMRHVLGTSYIGWPKPVAFSHYIKENVPTCECVPIYEDIFEEDREGLRRVMEETRPTRILAVTDSLRIQYLCQRVALHYQIPLMAVWCDNNAVEGEIFLWEPGQAQG